VQNKCKHPKNASWGIKQKLLFLHAISQLLVLHACLLPDFSPHSGRLERSRRIASADTTNVSEDRPLHCD